MTKEFYFHSCLIKMGTPETVLKGSQRRIVHISKSYDPIDFANTFNHYDSSATFGNVKQATMRHAHYPLVRDKDEIRNSMLAYTNYVVQKQRRNQLSNERKSLFASQESQRSLLFDAKEHLKINAKHIAATHSTHGFLRLKLKPLSSDGDDHKVSLPLSSRIPVPDIKKQSRQTHKNSGINTQGYLSRGNTFPPSVDNDSELELKPLYTVGLNPSSIQTIESEGGANKGGKANNVSNSYSVNKTRKLGVQKINKLVQAWDNSNSDVVYNTDYNTVQQQQPTTVDLSIMGSKPLKKHVPLKLNPKVRFNDSQLKSEQHRHNEKANSNVTMSKHSDCSSDDDESDDDYDEDSDEENADDECDYFEEPDKVKKESQSLKHIPKGPSEETLKSAIETLKMMEKQLEKISGLGNNTNIQQRLKGVNNGYVHTNNNNSDKTPVSKGNSGSDSSNNAVKIRMKKMKRLKMPKQKLDIIPELDCEHSFTSEENGAFKSGRNTNKLKLRHAKKSRLELNPIEESSDEESDACEDTTNDNERTNFSTNTLNIHEFQAPPPLHFVDKTTFNSIAKKNKAKLDIRNKMKNKHNKLFYIEQV